MSVGPRHSRDRVDLLVVGAGIMGAAVARTVRDAVPGVRIVMVDAGRPLGPVAGHHVHDGPDEELRTQYALRSAPGSQAMYVGAPVVPVAHADVRDTPPGMYPWRTLGADLDQLPGAAAALNAGGMGVHWSAATPTPWGQEVYPLTGSAVWHDELAAARTLLRVQDDPFGPTAAGRSLQAALTGVFADVSAPGREPRPMPMAVQTLPDGRLVRTGPTRILPRMAEPDGGDLRLLTGTQVVRLRHDGHRVQGARLRDVATGVEHDVDARATVVTADPLRTPQLLHASQVPAPALGRFLNEHAFLTGRVLVEPDRLDLADLPAQRPGEQILGMHWLPHSGPSQPFHGTFIQRLLRDEDGRPTACSVALSFYVPKQVREENRLELDPDVTDATGMPRMSARFERSVDDLLAVEAARDSVRRAAESLGAFDPDHDVALLPPGSSLHLTGTARAGLQDDGASVCDPAGRVWGFANLFLAGGAVVPTALVGNSTLAATVTAVRAGRALSSLLGP